MLFQTKREAQRRARRCNAEDRAAGLDGEWIVERTSRARLPWTVRLVGRSPRRFTPEEQAAFNRETAELRRTLGRFFNGEAS